MVSLQPNIEGSYILIVEDTYVNYLLLEEILVRAGARVDWAKNGDEAIELFKEKNFDIVLLDIQMRTQDEGFQVIKKMRAIENKKNKIIIAQTAVSMVEEREKISEAGFDGCISKPIEIKNLFKILNDSLSNN